MSAGLESASGEDEMGLPDPAYEAGQSASLDVGDACTIEIVWIPPGEYWMGARGEYNWAEPTQSALISQGFWMGRTPITQAQYRSVMDNRNPSSFAGADDADQRPVENVYWDDCRRFAHRVSLRLPELSRPGWRVDLPTEAQWEHACRAGTETAYHTGNDRIALQRAGWFDQNSDGHTHAVGAKEPNAWGLFDMHGNVWEWCADGWEDEPYHGHAERLQDPFVAPVGLTCRPVRGGSWASSAWWCRSGNRVRQRAGYSNNFLGFRIGVFRGAGWSTVEEAMGESN
jgi:formylglycine-generating enzyme required for sulfatase activity